VRLYAPLIFRWARRMGAPPDGAADLVQDVLTTLVRTLPEFSYDPDGSFRAWLKAVTLNTWRRACRAAPPGAGANGAAALAGAAVEDHTGLLEEAEYRRHLVARALALMQAEFEPNTWRACWEYTVADRPAREVAEELGITVNAVYIAKSRVIRRLHQELKGLLG
jgi:RNA polymerase sigma-70 factor (ECF subfamily)